MSRTTEVVELLEQGELEMEGLVPWGSNYTFLVQICRGKRELSAIYKPSKGERPLWDFDRGTLCQRERAAFLVGEALGWHMVPPTILRDGPHGWGSVQQFVEHDPEQHYLTFQGRYVEQAQRIALFDVVINNADRKSGHVLLGTDGQLWAIDHGVSFHTDYKLRSVIWDFIDQPIPSDLLEDLRRFQVCLAGRHDETCFQLMQLLTGPEVGAMSSRLERLTRRGIFPGPGPGRHYPWPII